MKPGKRFKKSIKKFVMNRIYLWDLVYIEEGQDISAGIIVSRFVNTCFIYDYRQFDDENYKQINIIDKFKGKASFIQIYNKFRGLNSADAFLIARQLAKRPEFELRFITHLKELR